VQAFIKSLYDNELGIDFTAVLTKIRTLAKGIRKSTLRWEMFEKSCKDLNVNPRTIPLDIKVRWNSILHMLEAAIYLRKPIARFLFTMALEEDDNPTTRGDEIPFHERCQMTDQEWDLLEVLYIFLLPFKRVTARFESNKQNPEIDYLFFAYDRMFNHIEDVLFSLRTPEALGNLECAPVFETALDSMKAKLKEYYDKTSIPFVYSDAMILNPRCKLSIFSEPTWSDIDTTPYTEGFRRRFETEYKSKGPVATTSHGLKRPAADDNDDDEFQVHLAERAAKRSRLDDYKRWMDILNDSSIKSALGYWKVHGPSFPDLAMMARDTLAVPVSGSSVERIFSAAGRIATWQRSRLRDSTIADIMMYRAALNLTDFVESELEEDPEWDDLPVPERLGKIPAEWEQDWWKRKLRLELRPEIERRFLQDNE